MSKVIGAVAPALAILGLGLADVQKTHAQDVFGPHVWASIGWSSLDLPDFAFSLTHENRNAAGNFDPLQFVDRKTDDDGDFDGGNRLDFGASGLELDAGQTAPVVLGLKGFYAHFDSRSATDCDETATAPSVNGGITCTFIPLSIEADNPANFQIGATESHSGFVERDVKHWGGALEALVAGTPQGPFAMKVGAAYRRIDQQTEYFVAGDQGFQNPVAGTAEYSETLDTGYLGGYLGLVGNTPLGDGLSFNIDGEVGLYSANTDYSGNYSYSITRVNTSSLDLSEDEVSLIAALKLELSKQIGSINVSAFTLGEYYSYAPSMIYKSNDVTNSGGAGGDALQTEIDEGDAWSFTVGGKLSISLN